MAGLCTKPTCTWKCRSKSSFHQCLVIANSRWWLNCSRDGRSKRWIKHNISIHWRHSQFSPACSVGRIWFRHCWNARVRCWFGTVWSVTTVCHVVVVIIIIARKKWRAVLTIHVESFQCPLGNCAETGSYLWHDDWSFGSFIFNIFILPSSYSIKSPDSIVRQVICTTKSIYWKVTTK